MLNRLRRFFRLLKVRKLEIELHSIDLLLASETSDEALMISTYRLDLRKRLAKARADYTATFEPGVRFTWRNG